MNSVYHSGELAVQARAGVQAMAQRVGNSIHSAIPPAAQSFLAEQPMAVIASTDTTGHLWASLLTGTPGFLQVLDEQTLRIDATPAPDDPLHDNLQVNTDVGLIAIDFASRKRMRLNGKVQRADSAMLIHAQQVYANCPKYIQARTVESSGQRQSPTTIVRTAALTETHRHWLAGADTFFIATASPQGGADASHRGGNPGFVHVVDKTTLVWPDYAGNTMFNTLGNIAVNPQAGLLFLDFEQGRTLQLMGTAEIVWDEAEIAKHAGAERLVAYRVEEAVERTGVLPFTSEFENYSPFNPTA